MKLSRGAIGHILNFIRDRHVGDVRSAGEHQMWLKRRLKKGFSSVLLKHGDPDTQGYLPVMAKWFDEERKFMR